MYKITIKYLMQSVKYSAVISKIDNENTKKVTEEEKKRERRKRNMKMNFNITLFIAQVIYT